MEKKGTMQKKLLIFTVFILNFSAFALDINKIPDNIRKKINNGNIYTSSNVSDHFLNKIHFQKFQFQSYAMHSKSCNIALSKISQYENYKSYIGYIKRSSYSKKINQLYLRIDHLLLPRPFVLVFKIDRMIEPGIYKFLFQEGILVGLKGKIDITEYKNKCYFSIKANWEGKHSGFPNTMFEMFTSTLAKLGINKIFKISQTL